MSRHWREPYSLDVASQLGIRDLERCLIGAWDEEGAKTFYGLRLLHPYPEWIYYVEVCGFTFGFFSIHMMRAYLNYYSQKVLPSRIRNTPHCNHDLRQDVFTRLPLYLREEPKRLKVVSEQSSSSAIEPR